MPVPLQTTPLAFNLEARNGSSMTMIMTTNLPPGLA